MHTNSKSSHRKAFTAVTGERVNQAVQSNSQWNSSSAMAADLYERFSLELNKYACRLLRDPGRAEDVVQEAFAVTIAAAERGTVIRDPRRWLQRCTRNLCLNELRTDPNTSLSEHEEPVARENLIEVVDFKERCRAVNEALGELPESQRSAFLLSEMRGLSYREIAAVIGRTEEAVSKLLFRARRYVRAKAGVGGNLVAPVVLQLQPYVTEPQTRHMSLPSAAQARISKLEAWINALLQRAAEALSQPVLPMIAGALMVVVLATPPQTEGPAYSRLGPAPTAGSPNRGTGAGGSLPVTGRPGRVLPITRGIEESRPPGDNPNNAENESPIGEGENPPEDHLSQAANQDNNLPPTNDGRPGSASSHGDDRLAGDGAGYGDDKLTGDGSGSNNSLAPPPDLGSCGQLSGSPCGEVEKGGDTVGSKQDPAESHGRDTSLAGQDGEEPERLDQTSEGLDQATDWSEAGGVGSSEAQSIDAEERGASVTEPADGAETLNG